MARWRFLPLCPDDLDAVVTIEAQSFEQPWKRPAIADELAIPESRAFVLGLRDRETLHHLGAYIFLRILADEVHIMKVAVAPDRRGLGLAARITEQALNAVRREGCGRAILEVRTSNTTAIRLYTRLGFETIGERKRYYRPSGEDALVMAKKL